MIPRTREVNCPTTRSKKMMLTSQIVKSTVTFVPFRDKLKRISWFFWKLTDQSTKPHRASFQVVLEGVFQPKRSERVKGIEPSYAAWEAAVLPLNYTRMKTGFNLIDPGRFASVDFLKIATPDSLLPALAGEHDLVAFGIGAHGEVGRFAIFGLRVVAQLAASSDDLGGSSDHVGNLKAQACPSGLVLASAVDTDNATADVDLGDVLGLADDTSPQRIAIKGDGARGVFCPDDVFDAFDDHDLVSQL